MLIVWLGDRSEARPNTRFQTEGNLSTDLNYKKLSYRWQSARRV